MFEVFKYIFIVFGIVFVIYVTYLDYRKKSKDEDTNTHNEFITCSPMIYTRT